MTLAQMRKSLEEAKVQQDELVNSITETNEALEGNIENLSEERVENLSKAILGFKEEHKTISNEITRLVEEINIQEEKNASIMNSTKSISSEMINMKKGNDKELEKSFMDAWSKAIKGDKTEYQKMLSTAPTDGLVEDAFGGLVPTFVVEGIQAKMENYGTLLAKAGITTIAGLVKFSYEVLVTPAQNHKEGAAPITDEEITLGQALVSPEMIKKTITWTDELEMMSAVDLVNYLTNEFIREITKKIEFDMINGAKDMQGLEGISAYAGSEFVKAEVVVETEFANILSLLKNCRGANKVIFMNEETFYNYQGLVDTTGRPIFNSIANNGQVINTLFGVRVDFLDALPAFDEAVINQTFAICMVDGAYRINAPRGMTPSFILDRVTGATADTARLTGKCFLGGRPVKLKGISTLTKGAIPA